MGNNKNAQLRYDIYHDIFSRRFKKHTKQSILEEIHRVMQDHGGQGISSTQFAEDLKFLRSEKGGSAPIEMYKEGKKNYYRYSDPTYQPARKPYLTKEQVDTLNSAIAVLSEFEGLPQFDSVYEIITSIECQFISPEPSNKKIVFFEDNKEYRNRHLIADLFHYIKHKQNLKIQYQPFNDEVREWIVSPACLRQYMTRWYLFGYNHSTTEYRIQTTPLDRIISISADSSQPFHDLDIDWQEYFDDFIGISKMPGTHPTTVHLRISAAQAPYILTKPIHPSQKKYPQPDGSLDIKIRVLLNRELENLICSQAEHIEVIAPEDLRQTIAERLRIAAKKYEI
jgi:predicted DNA-binding transcriptional regulator YafY